MECVIDLQGFKDSSNNFIIKEAAIVFLNANCVGNWIAVPPYPFTELSLRAQLYNNLETKHIHGLEWFQGDVGHRQIHANLRELASNANNIFVYGREKVKVVESIITRCVFDLTEMECPWQKGQPQNCIHHGINLRNPLYACALARVNFYKEWLIENYEKVSALCYSVTAPQTENTLKREDVEIIKKS